MTKWEKCSGTGKAPTVVHTPAVGTVTRPRGFCSVCGRNISVSVEGRINRHSASVRTRIDPVGLPASVAIPRRERDSLGESLGRETKAAHLALVLMRYNGDHAGYDAMANLLKAVDDQGARNTALRVLGFDHASEETWQRVREMINRVR